MLCVYRLHVYRQQRLWVFPFTYSKLFYIFIAAGTTMMKRALKQLMYLLTQRLAPADFDSRSVVSSCICVLF